MEEKEEIAYKHGDTVEVIADTCYHAAPIGTILTIKEIDTLSYKTKIWVNEVDSYFRLEDIKLKETKNVILPITAKRLMDEGPFYMTDEALGKHLASGINHIEYQLLSGKYSKDKVKNLKHHWETREEKPVASKYKIGDVVEIVDDASGHCQPIGTKLVIKRIIRTGSGLIQYYFREVVYYAQETDIKYWKDNTKSTCVKIYGIGGGVTLLEACDKLGYVWASGDKLLDYNSWKTEGFPIIFEINPNGEVMHSTKDVESRGICLSSFLGRNEFTGDEFNDKSKVNTIRETESKCRVEKVSVIPVTVFDAFPAEEEEPKMDLSELSVSEHKV